jgi:hypothetical protein
VTLHDPAADLDEITRNVAARLRRRYPLVDPDEINLLVAEAAASIDTPNHLDRHSPHRRSCSWEPRI